jgi:exosortase
LKVNFKLLEGIRNLHLQFIAVSIMVLTILIVYWQDFSILANEAFQNEATNHIILVPLLTAFLIYRKKEHIKATLTIERLKPKTNIVSLSEVTGIALCLSALLLYWYGSFTFYPLEYHIASLVIFLMGLILTLSNIKTLTVLMIPILFLLFLTPPPSIITYTAGAAIGNFNAQTSYALLRTLGVPIALSSEYGPPTLIVNNPSEGNLEFAVDPACSGIYSLIAFIMFASFVFCIAGGSIKKKIALFSIGFVILPILNIFRISLIVFIAYRLDVAIAMTIFHTFSGWLLISLGILLLLLIAEKLLHLQIFERKNKIPLCPKCTDISKNNTTFCSHCGKLHRNHLIKPDKRFWAKVTALLLVSYLIISSIQAPVFAFTQELILTNADPEANVHVFPPTSDYEPIFLYRDQNFEEVSRQDASLLYAYLPHNTSDSTIYVLVAVAGSITNLHSWEVCLVTSNQAQGRALSADVLESRDTLIMQNPPITARYFVFHYPSEYYTLANYTQVTLYWYQKALFKTGLTIEPRYIRISLIILTTNPDDSPKLEPKLINMGQLIAAHWEPLKAQQIALLGIPTMQALLISAILIAITLQATQYTQEWRRKTTNLKIFEKLASPKEKLLYRTIKNLTQETRETTTQNIISAFENNTGKVRVNELIDMLANLQKHRLIDLDITDIGDQPRLVWKP